MKKYVIACGPCEVDTIVEVPNGVKKPEHCPICGDCDTAVWLFKDKDK